MITKKTLLTLAIGLGCISHLKAQSVYSADWSTLSGSNGSYMVAMTLESGPLIAGTASYQLSISNNNGREFFANGGSVLTSGPYTADVAQETNRFSISSTQFAGFAYVASSDVTNFTNISGIEGRLLNPAGNAVTSFPIDLSETDSASLAWTSRNFGFDTLRTDPDASQGGSNIWDEWTMDISQTWTTVPEPSSTLLVGLGGIALIFRKRAS